MDIECINTFFSPLPITYSVVWFWISHAQKCGMHSKWMGNGSLFCLAVFLVYSHQDMKSHFWSVFVLYRTHCHDNVCTCGKLLLFEYWTSIPTLILKLADALQECYPSACNWNNLFVLHRLLQHLASSIENTTDYAILCAYFKNAYLQLCFIFHKCTLTSITQVLQCAYCHIDKPWMPYKDTIWTVATCHH